MGSFNCKNCSSGGKNNEELILDINSIESTELKIELYPKNEPRYNLVKMPIMNTIIRDAINHSLDENKKLAFTETNVPVLNGFYTAHTNHYPIRIKPDDIWLLIVQAFSHHVSSNFEKLSNMFVNFESKKELEISFELNNIKDINNQKVLENFNSQISNKMKEYIGEKLLKTLTPDFTTTNQDLSIICKISILGTFKQYYEYSLCLVGCGIPYIILEGTAQDYKKIIYKCQELKKFKFDWYIKRVIPHIQKMVEAKEGKIDIGFFKNMIQKKEVTEAIIGSSGIKQNEEKVDYISGWFLNFFGFFESKNNNGQINTFLGNSMKVKDFNKFASQQLIIPFKVVDPAHKKQFLMKYNAGFVGCDQNDKNEVYPVAGWLISPFTEEEKANLYL